MTDPMRYVTLSPIDTWFFRDGRPMHSDESVLKEAKSLFPPFAFTASGCLRAALARNKGWDGKSAWEKKLTDVLGDYYDLGGLCFQGPFLCKDGELFYPLPKSLLGMKDPEGNWHPKARLVPSGKPLFCDMGEALFPEMKPYADKKTSPEWDSAEDVYISETGLEDVLTGSQPDLNTIIRTDMLWEHESRISIKRNHETWTTEENALYSAQHVRLRQGVSLVCGVAGLPDGFTFPDSPQPFGGESRLAFIKESKDIDLNFQTHDTRDISDVALYLLSPTKLIKENLMTGANITLEDIGTSLELKSAVLGPSMMCGGWWTPQMDGGSRNNRCPVLLEGTVLFGTLQNNQALRLGQLVSIGQDCEFGYGLAVVGTWDKGNESGESNA